MVRPERLAMMIVLNPSGKRDLTVKAWNTEMLWGDGQFMSSRREGQEWGETRAQGRSA